MEDMDNTLLAAIIAATASFVGILIQLLLGFINNRQLTKIEQKKIDADLIAKSRIEWIQNVRQIMSEFLTETRGISHLYTLLVEDGNTLTSSTNTSDNLFLEDRMEKTREKANARMQKMFQLRNLLLLNFSDNEGNKKIIDEITKVTHTIDVYSAALNAENYNFSVTYNYIDNLTKTARDYFKEEWEVAKLGK